MTKQELKYKIESFRDSLSNENDRLRERVGELEDTLDLILKELGKERGIKKSIEMKEEVTYRTEYDGYRVWAGLAKVDYIKEAKVLVDIPKPKKTKKTKK